MLVGQERLGQPLADVALLPRPAGAQMIDREARRDGRQVRLRRLDLHALFDERTLITEEGVLNDVLRLGNGAEHPVGDREQQRA
jgi:hypothetical protein